MPDVTMPQLGETVTEGTITKWFKQVGDQVAEDEVLFEVSTDKVDSEVPSPSGGYVTEILVQEGETVDVGTRLAVIADAPPSGGAASAPVAEPSPAAEPAPVPPPAPERQPAPQAPQAPQAQPAPQPQPERPVPVAARPGTDDETVPFTNIRRRTAEHMVRSKATSAHVLTAIEIDFERVDRVRRAVRDEFKAREGFSLTYLPFI